jgi:hypothetical protein
MVRGMTPLKSFRDHETSRSDIAFGHCIGAVLSSLQWPKEGQVNTDKSKVLQGTLDLMVLKASTPWAIAWIRHCTTH